MIPFLGAKSVVKSQFGDIGLSISDSHFVPAVLFFNIRNCQTAFQRSCSILHFNQKSLRIPQPLVLLVFFHLALLLGVWWYLLALVCISLITDEMGHLFTSVTVTVQICVPFSIETPAFSLLI